MQLREKDSEEMDDRPIDSDLLLPDLYIENFRGIKKLSIPQLGRVTLLAGRNSVGKTTTLEAIQVYAARARYAVLEGLLTNREEISIVTEEEGGNFTGPDWRSLFYGRDTVQHEKVTIGPTSHQAQLSLETIDLSELSDEEIASLGRLFPESLVDGEMQTLRAKFHQDSWTVPALLFRDPKSSLYRDRGSSVYFGDPSRRARELGYRVRREESRLPPTATCVEIGPGIVSNYALSQFWDAVALTDDESRATQALRLILGNDVERVAVVGDDRTVNRRGGRRAIVRLKSSLRPVPLKSLGEGALRLFGVALALANSRNGFLVIDEAENGIHHSVQQDFWRMVLQTARENNVQVFATTHSLDCVRGFAMAAVGNKNVEGVLVRLEKEDEGLRAVRYSERRLRIVAEQGTEVR